MPPDSLTKEQQQALTRAAGLRADPDAERVERNRVFCRVCRIWVPLDPRLDFERSRWSRHKKQQSHSIMSKKETGIIHTRVPLGSERAPIILDLDNDRQVANSERTDRIEISNAAEYLVTSTNQAAIASGENDVQSGSTLARYEMPGTMEHLQLLEPAVLKRAKSLINDTDAQKVLPDRILCRVCDEWIMLDTLCPYHTQPWIYHKEQASHIHQRFQAEKAEKSSAESSQVSSPAHHSQAKKIVAGRLTLSLMPSKPSPAPARASQKSKRAKEDDPMRYTPPPGQQPPSKDSVDVEIPGPSHNAAHTVEKRELRPRNATQSQASGSRAPNSIPRRESTVNRPFARTASESLLPSSGKCHTVAQLIKTHIGADSHFSEYEMEIAAFLVEELIEKGALKLQCTHH